MANNEPLYDDNPKVKPEDAEILPIIKNQFKGAIVDPFSDVAQKPDIPKVKNQFKNAIIDPEAEYLNTEKIAKLKAQRENFEKYLEVDAQLSKLESQQKLISQDESSTGDIKIARLKEIQSEKEPLEEQRKIYKEKYTGLPEEPSQLKQAFDNTFEEAKGRFSNYLATGNIWRNESDVKRDIGRFAKGIEGFNNIFGEALTGIAIEGNAIDRELFGSKNVLEDGFVYKLGQWMSSTKGSEHFLEGKPDLAADILNGTGSSLGFLAASRFLPSSNLFKSKLLKAIFSETGKIALVGGQSQYPEEYLKALKSTGSYTKAFLTGAVNFIAGTTEALPLTRFLERIGAPKKVFGQVVKDMFVQGTEEGLQEMFQQAYSNIGAKNFYDATRELSEGVVYGGAVGFLSGALMTMSAHTANLYKDATEVEPGDLKADAEAFNKLVIDSYKQAYQKGEQKAEEILKDVVFNKKSEEPDRTYTPERVESLEDNEVFVFGSNPLGINGNPEKYPNMSASIATKNGWVQQGEKMDNRLSDSGKSFGITTVTKPGARQSKSLSEIKIGISKMLETATSMPEKKFLVTKFATNYGGYKTEQIKQLFSELKNFIPDNVVLPKEFEVRNDVKSETTQQESTQKIDEVLTEIETTSQNKDFQNLAKALKGRLDESITFKQIDEIGEYSPTTKEIGVNSGLTGDEKYSSVLHESVHRFTVDGITNDAVFRSKVKFLYNAVNKQYSLKFLEDKLNTGSEIEKLSEFIAHGLTSQDFRTELSKIQIGTSPAKKSAWREFIENIYVYIKEKLGLTPQQFSETALNNLISGVSNYIEREFPVQKVYNQQVQKSNIEELKAPIQNEVVTNFGENIIYDATLSIDRKTEAFKDIDLEKRAWKSYSVSGIVKDFLDKDGNRIYNSAEDMLKDIQQIYKNNPNEKDALQEFKDKYESRIEEKETKNAFSYIENVFHSIKSKTAHKVATFKLDVRGNVIIEKHSNVFPTTTGGQNSVIYDKRFYEEINENVSKVLGKQLIVWEIKNHSNFLDKYKTVKHEKIINDIYNKYQFVPLFNKSEWLLIDRNSILTPEEINGIKNKVTDKISEGVLMTDYIFYKYWNIVFNPDSKPEFAISQSQLLKRMANLTGESASTLITPKIEAMLRDNPGLPMYIKDDKLMVKTVQLDMKESGLPSEVIKHLKETLGDWYKDEVIGDGAVFELPEVHNMSNLINGVDFEKWGRVNKNKTFEFGEQFIKAGQHKAFKFSPIYKWMKLNNIGKIVLSSSRKIKYGQGNIGWNDIVENKLVDKSIIFEYDMRQDAHQLSKGKIKNKTKGVMPSWITTTLTSYMSDEQRKTLLSHFKNHINAFKSNTLDNILSADFIGRELIDFMDENEDLFESMSQQFISKQVREDVRFTKLIDSIDYYKQNVLGKQIQNVLQHEESNGASPVLMPDMGALTGYRDEFIRQNTNENTTKDEAEIEANKYFDEFGFFKKGYRAIDKATWEALGKPFKLIEACNPPSLLQDIRAVEIILVLPTDTFEGHKISTSGYVGSVGELQVRSGKDFDIDAVPIIAVKGKELEELWDFLKKLEGDKELDRIVDDFKDWNIEDKFVEPENDIKAIENKVNIKSLDGKIDEPLAHVIKLFGINQDFKNLDTTNPVQFVKLMEKLNDDYIGRLYNVRALYSAILENGGSIEHNGIKISINKKKITRDKGLLYFLTNYSLDWLSDNKLLSFNYNIDKLNTILYKVELDGNLIDPDRFYYKNGIIHYNASDLVQKIYTEHLKPSRLLLRRPENESRNIKDYAELKNQLLDAWWSLQNPNPFDGSTIIETTRDFLNTYMQSNIGVLGLTKDDIDESIKRLNEEIVPNADNLEKEQEVLNGKVMNPIRLLGKILNRYFNIGAFNIEYVDATSNFGKELKNNEGALKELQQYTKFLKDMKAFPSAQNLFSDLLIDMFTKQKFIVRKQNTYKDVQFSSKGTKVLRQYYITQKNGHTQYYYKEVESSKVIFESELFDEFQSLIDNEGSYPIQKTITNIDIKDLCQMFVFKDNPLLKDYAKETMEFIYEEAAKEIKGYSKLEQRLFFKLGSSLYDDTKSSEQRHGRRYRLAFFEDAKSITYEQDTLVERGNKMVVAKKGENVEYRNLSPYMMYLSKAGEVNNEAKQLYQEIINSLIQTASLKYDEKLDKIKNGEMLPIKFFKRKLSIPTVAPKDGLVSRKTDIDIAVDKVMQNMPQSIRKFQVVNFWNINHKDKISESKLNDTHYKFYVDNLVRNFFNLEVIYAGKKAFVAQEDLYKKLDDILKDSDSKYNRVTTFAARLLPAQSMIRRFSDFNIRMLPNEKIIYVHNSQAHEITPFGLMSSFGFTASRVDDIYQVSGAMIAQEIMRKVNDGFNDNAQIYEANAIKLRKIWQVDNSFITEHEKADGFWQGDGFKELMFNIAEGTDTSKILHNAEIDWNSIFVINERTKTNPNGDDRTLTTNIQLLTEKARELLKLKGLYHNTGNNILDNNTNAANIRAVMGAIAQRYLYDSYSEQQIRQHQRDLEYLFQYVSRLSEQTAKFAGDYITKYLKQSNKMLSQIKGMKEALAKKGKFYMPHTFQDEKMFKQSLIKAYMKADSKLSLEKANDKANKMFLQLEDEANYLGVVKESLSHMNFSERKFPELEDYLKDENVTERYFNTLNLMFRQRILTVYEEVNKEWLQEDNKFMQEEIQWQSAILKTQNAVYRSIQSLNQLDARDFISFGVSSDMKAEVKEINLAEKTITVYFKTKKTDATFMFQELSEISSENGNITDISTVPIGEYIAFTRSYISYGEVSSIDKKNKKIYVKSAEDNSIDEFVWGKLHNVKLVSGILTSKQLSLTLYKIFGKELDFSKMDVFFRTIVNWRNKALLGVKFYYAQKNMFGNLMQSRAMYGSDYSKQASAKLSQLQALLEIRDSQKATDIIQSDIELTSSEKDAWTMLLNEATAFFGGVNQIMGRIGFVADTIQSQLTKQHSEYLMNINKQWELTNLELKPLLEKINANPSTIGRHEINFIKKVFGSNGMAKNFYDRHNLSAPMLLFNRTTGRHTYNVGVKEAEESNRQLTVLTTVAAFADILDLENFSESDKQILKPIMLSYAKTMYEQGIKMVDFLYQPGLDLSHWDSTMGGKVLLQFSHFQNMLTNTYLDRWIESAKQIKKFGTVAIYKQEFTYEAHLLNPVTGEVTVKTFKQFSDLRRALSMTWRSFIWSIFGALYNAFGIYAFGYVTNSILKALVEALFINSIGDGISISLVNAMQHLAGYIVQASLNTMPSDVPDDDKTKEQKRAEKIKKGLNLLFWMSEEEYIAWELKKLKQTMPDFINDGLTQEMLRRTYKRRLAREYSDVLPFMGVGLGDIYTLLMSAIISKGEFDNQMELLQNTGSTFIPGMSLTLPFIQAMKPDFMFKSDPYYSSKEEFKVKHANDLDVQKEIDNSKQSIKDIMARMITKDTPVLKSETWKELEKKMTDIRQTPTNEQELKEYNNRLFEKVQSLINKNNPSVTKSEQEEMYNKVSNFLNSEASKVFQTQEEVDKFINNYISTFQQIPDAVKGKIKEGSDLSKGIIGGYDIKSYATDPNHEVAIANLYAKYSDIGDKPEDIQPILDKYGAPFSAEDVIESAEKYDVDPILMLSIMEQDSSFGTKGKGARTYNPGNVGNTDSGATVNFGDWQSGLDAVAKNLAKRKVN